MKRIIIVFLAILLVLIPFSSSADKNKSVIDQEVVDALEDYGYVNVIVELKESKDILSVSSKKPTLTSKSQNLKLTDIRSNLKSTRKNVRDVQDDFLESISEEKNGIISVSSSNLKNQTPDFLIDHRFSMINAFSGNVTEKGLELLASSPYVKKVALDKKLWVTLASTVPSINSSYAYNQTMINHSISVLKGAGQTVCVIDTGANYSHPYLAGCSRNDLISGQCNKVPFGYDYIDGDPDPMDDHGHGTHVSGIVASTFPNYNGVAPEVKVIVMRACKDIGGKGTCSGLAIMKSIDWCINHSFDYNISVISMSIGDEEQYNSTNPCDPTFDTLFERAHDNNMLIAVATGNENYEKGISWPACTPYATSVGATDDYFNVTSYSNFGYRNSIVAPGGTSSDKIFSLNLNGFSLASSYGTSMAAPHAAGAAAILYQFKFEEAGYRPSSDMIEDALNLTGDIAIDRSTGKRFSRINIGKALEYIREIPILEYVDPTPDDDEWVDTKNVTINITSNENLSNATLLWNGREFHMDGEGKNWYYQASGNGNFTYLVRGIDNDGNISYTQARTVIMNSSCLIPIEGTRIAKNWTICKDTYSQVRNIVIQGDNLVIDCNNTIFNGNSQNRRLFLINSSSHVTLKNCIINNYNIYPLRIQNSDSILLYNSTLNQGGEVRVLGTVNPKFESAFINSTQIKFDNSNMSKVISTKFNGSGILYFLESRDVLINQNNFYESYNLVFSESVNISFVDNNYASDSDESIQFTDSSNILMTKNNISSNNKTIIFSGDNNGTFENNSFSSNDLIIYMEDPSSNINLEYNYFGFRHYSNISERIIDSHELEGRGTLDFSPWFLVSNFTVDSDLDDDSYSSSILGGNDCDDSQFLINPSSTELLDSIDNNCNNVVDEGFIFGNSSSISSNLIGLIIEINGSTNLSEHRNGIQKVVLSNSSHNFIEFYHNFSKNKLNLSLISISSTIANSSAFFKVSGIEKSISGFRKKIFFSFQGDNSSGVCVIDKENVDFINFSDDCNGTFEQFVVCDGDNYSNYSCTTTGNNSEIYGLSHSAIWEMNGCTDKDGDGYGSGCNKGNDCNDQDNSMYQGAPCVKKCYKGARYNSECVCTGGTYTCDSSSTSSGGGGGGGGGIPQGDSDSKKFSKSFYNLKDYAELIITDTAFSFRNVNITVDEELYNVEIELEIISKEDAPTFDGDIYQAIKIDHQNLDGSITGAEIEFRINKSWIDLGNSDVYLYRYENSWKRYYTEKISEDADYVLYRANVPGFSYFIVNAEKKGVVLDDNSDSNKISDNDSSNDLKTITDKNLTTAKIEEPTLINGSNEVILNNQNSFSDNPLIRVFFMLLLVGAFFGLTISAVFAHRNYQQRNQHLRGYVEHRLNKEHKEHEIINTLVDIGWDKKLVHKAIETVKKDLSIKNLEKTIEEKLNLGHKDHEIHKHLISLGYVPEEIAKCLSKMKKIHFNKKFPTEKHVHEYIDKRLDLGHHHEDIKEDLINLGLKEHHAHKHVHTIKEKKDMITLVKYIKKRLDKGETRITIFHKLNSEGWPEKLVWKAFSEATKELKK